MLIMYRISYFLILICSNLSVYVLAETDWEVTMISDIIHAVQRPSAVIATLCWPKHKQIRLHATVNKQGSHLIMLRLSNPGEDFHLWHANIPIEHHIVFLTDLDCPSIADYFKDSNAKNLFRSPFRWILFKRYDNETEKQTFISKALENIELSIDSEVILAQPLSKTSFDLYYVYKIGITKTLRTECYGSWDRMNGFRKTSQHDLPTSLRRLDVQGYPISVCFVLRNNDSINHLTDGINDHIDTITKVNFLTVDHLLDFLNASSKLVFVDSWGYKVNDTWTGLTGYLIRKEAEIGGSPMFLTSQRMAQVDFISSPTPTQIRFVFRQPKLSFTSNLYLLSFKTSVWYSLVALVFLMFLALLAVASWEWRRCRNDRKISKDARILRGNVKDVALLVFGAACQQGSPVELKGGLGRAVTFVLFLTLMFLYTSYAANIVALLQSSSSQIRTLEDLLNSRIKLGAEDNVYNRYYFSTATAPIQKAIYETKIAPPKSKPEFISMEEGVKKMQKGLYGFHMEIGVGYKFVSKYFRENEKCGLTEIEYLQIPNPTPWQAVQKNTPFKEMFKIGLKRIKEHGLQTRENERFYEKRPKCSGSKSHFISVTMVDCYPALLVLAYGMIFAVLFLFLEILFEKRRSLMCRRKH